MKKISGFTIVEVIVVVAVLAVVVTMATPDLTRIFAKQSELNETIRLGKIYDSLHVYAQKNKKLPASSNWAASLVEFSELSEDQIENDTWGTARRYSVFTKDVSYLGGTYKVYYAVVTSAGLDRTNQAILPVNTTAFGQFDFTTNTSGNSIDDMAIKYTDQLYKLNLLETTLDRMEKLSLALEKYARVKQITGIDKVPDTSDSYIYFPKDARTGDNGDYLDSSISGISSAEGVETISGNANEAIGLARLLGLPDDYGTDALTDTTMWYVSNPGPDGSNICSNARTEAPFYPPVIMIDSTGNPC